MRRAADTERADLIVVGSGIAGASAALEAAAAGLDVAVVTKAALGDGGATPLAQGGVAVALAPGDSAAAHSADTESAAAGLADPEVVSILTREGPERVLALIRAGANFDRDGAGELLFGREAAHGTARILHARGDATGAEISRALTAAVRAAPSIEVFEHAFALDLCLDHRVGRRVMGVWTRGAARDRLLLAPAVVLATGGAGRLYAATTNPLEATGDGVAMAARAGATLADLEFVQFHPTALTAGSDPLPLLTEALRGAGALLVDGDGRRFMPAVHPLAELAPRDVVARAIWERRQRWQPVFLDARREPGARLPQRFPTFFKTCRCHGIDPRTEPIPVSPAAHYSMGGIVVDAWGRSSLPGLWACGEAARTGVHGANRLASNSLLEGLVFGARVAGSVAKHHRESGRVTADPSLDDPTDIPISPRHHTEIRSSLRRLMWRHAGLVRTGAGLQRAAAQLEELEHELGPGRSETHNMLGVARLIVRAALARRESRGAHFRSDYPRTDPAWRRSLALELGEGGAIHLAEGPPVGATSRQQELASVS